MTNASDTTPSDRSAVSVTSTHDPALLSSLHSACFAEGWSKDAFADLVSVRNVTALIATRQAVGAVGYILIRCAADEAEIISLGVVPDARRTGVAGKLLADAMARATNQGATSMFLEVAEDNDGARVFYRKHRFDEVGRRPGYYAGTGGPAIDAIVMRASTVQAPAR